ncbi:hypothetical protein J2X67_005218 [Variovorax sp. 3319]|nr:hypothetical protein [Variovorax sp. 3319]
MHGSSVRKALNFPRTGAAGRPAFGGLTSCTASNRRTSHQWTCAVRSDRHAAGRKPAQMPRHMIVGRANRCRAPTDEYRRAMAMKIMQTQLSEPIGSRYPANLPHGFEAQPSGNRSSSIAWLQSTSCFPSTH